MEKEKSIVRNSKIGLFSILFTFIFFVFSLNLVSAVTTYSVENPTLLDSSNGNSNVQPLQDTIFLPDGLHIYEYNETSGKLYSGLIDNFNIGSINFIENITISPHDCGDYTFNLGYWIVDNGSHAYFTYECHIAFQPTWWAQVEHYTFGQAYNVSTMTFSENKIIYSEGGNPTNFLNAVWVNPSGDKMILTNNYQQLFVADLGYRYLVYNLNSSYNVSTLTFQKAYLLQNETSLSGRSDGLVFYARQGKGINEYVLSEAYNFSTIQKIFSFNVTTGVIPAYNHGNWVTPDISPPLIFTDFGNPFMLINIYDVNSDGLHYRKYALNEIAVSTGNQSEIPAPEETTFIIESVVNPIIGIFPNASKLTAPQKYGLVFFTMLLTAVILLLCVGWIIKDVPKPLIYITLIIELAEFIFFVSIGYISVGLLIILALIGCFVGFLMIKGRGSGG